MNECDGDQKLQLDPFHSVPSFGDSTTRREPAWVRGPHMDPGATSSLCNLGQPPNLQFFQGQMKIIARLNIKQDHSFIQYNVD